MGLQNCSFNLWKNKVKERLYRNRKSIQDFTTQEELFVITERTFIPNFKENRQAHELTGLNHRINSAAHLH